MRKVIFMLLVIAASTFGNTEVSAQAPTKVKTYTKAIRRTGIHGASDGVVKAADTLANADAGNIGHPVTYAYDLAFRYKVKKLSGTLAGYATLWGTNDTVGGPWYPIKATRTTCPTCVDSMATFSNADSLQFTWIVPKSPFSHYAIDATTTGTVTATHTLVTDYKY